MAFQAEQKIKSQILASLGTDQIFRLLSDSEVSVLMKTLGLLRNLLSTKPHIDHIMSLHAIQIMQVISYEFVFLLKFFSHKIFFLGRHINIRREPQRGSKRTSFMYFGQYSRRRFS